MAVRVMVAPAIANGAIAKGGAAKQREKAAPQKPKRRRSSVYDAEGNEVFITLMCLKCQKMRPLSQFGLRKMADGAIRNQPWCRTCRSGAGAERPRRTEAEAAPVEPTPPAPALAPSGPDAGAPPKRPGSVAAEVAAALAAGLRR